MLFPMDDVQEETTTTEAEKEASRLIRHAWLTRTLGTTCVIAVGGVGVAGVGLLALVLQQSPDLAFLEALAGGYAVGVGAVEVQVRVSERARKLRLEAHDLVHPVRIKIRRPDNLSF